MFSIQLIFNGENVGDNVRVQGNISCVGNNQGDALGRVRCYIYPAAVRIWWDLGSYFKLTHKSLSTREEKQPVCLA